MLDSFVYTPRGATTLRYPHSSARLGCLRTLSDIGNYVNFPFALRHRKARRRWWSISILMVRIARFRQSYHDYHPTVVHSAARALASLLVSCFFFFFFKGGKLREKLLHSGPMFTKEVRIIARIYRNRHIHIPPWISYPMRRMNRM